MKDILIKWFTDFNAFLIRISRGRIGGQLGTQSILILRTTGRKSGQPRSTPVAYFERDGRYLLVGSNWGRPKDADWILNLRQDPHGRIDVKGQSFPVQAREAEGDEYTRLWKYVTLRHPPYLRYEQMTSRRIPILILERRSESSR
jgi:deazaflavin-dependent oxidoreductase (nitroreductase family)